MRIAARNARVDPGTAGLTRAARCRYDPNLVCEISANTAGGTCNEYCAKLGRKCFHAQDNDGLCGVYDVSDERLKELGQDTSENGMFTSHGPMDIT